MGADSGAAAATVEEYFIMKDFKNLGALAIVRKAAEILKTHAKVFILLQGLIIGAVTLAALSQHLVIDCSPLYWGAPTLFWGVPTLELLCPVNEWFGHSRHPRPREYSLKPTLALAIIFECALCFTLTLPLAATIYSVGLHYANKAVSFRGLIRAAVSNLALRMTSTAVCILPLFYIIFGQIVVFNPPWMFAHRLLSLVSVAHTVILWPLGLAIYLGVNMTFSVAQGVTILGGDYGMSVWPKGTVMVKRKIMVALQLQLYMLLPNIIRLALAVVFYSALQGIMQVTIVRVLAAVVYLFWISFWTQFAALCYGVQYLSFKAYQDECPELNDGSPIADSAKTKEGYEPTWKAKDDLLLASEQTDPEAAGADGSTT